jgi:uncharacterized protein (DUF2336 family)
MTGQVAALLTAIGDDALEDDIATSRPCVVVRPRASAARSPPVRRATVAAEPLTVARRAMAIGMFRRQVEALDARSMTSPRRPGTR